MSTAANLLLVATERNNGRCRLSSAKIDAVLGGAILLDLAAAGRVEVDDDGKRAKAVVVDASPTDDPVLDKGLAVLGAKGPIKPRSAVPKMGKGIRDRVYEQLAESGAVTKTELKFWGILPYTRWHIADHVRRSNLMEGVRAVLLQNQPADADTGALIGLLAASDNLGFVVERSERKRAKARAKEVSRGDWASQGAHDAIAAANAAVIAAVAAGGAASSGGS